MDAADLDLFTRSVRHAFEPSHGAALDAALVDLGWLDALALDRPTAVAIVFELQGAAHASSSVLDHVLAASMGLTVDPAAGFVLPSFGQWTPPGELDGERLVVRGIGGASLPARDEALVVARSVDGDDVAMVVPTADLELRPVHGMDPELGLVEVTGTVPLGAARREIAPVDWSSSVTVARLALGHELVGVARRMLELARRHALERIQFGQAIGTFQAVRHRLADTLVGIEAADAALGAAWEDGTPTAAAMAKALAGRGARTAARHCQQVLGGIGFTTEHEFHLSVRRGLVLNELFGAALPLTRDLGAELLTTRRLPEPAPL